MDSVSLSPSMSGAPAASVWAELGPLLAGAAVGGPLGPMLTSSTRRGLLEAMGQIQSAGVRFEKAGRFYGRHQLSPQEALNALEESTASDLGFSLILPAGRRLDTLAGLQAADRCNTPGDPLAEALKSLAQQRIMGCPEAEYADLLEGRSLFTFIGNPEDEYEVTARTSDQVLAMDYLVGAGVDRGLESPERARLLKQAVDRGLLNRWSAYEQYSDPQPRVSIGSREEVPPLLVREADLADPDKLHSDHARYRAAFARYLSPAVGALGHSMQSVALPEQFRYPDGPFTLETRLYTYANLMHAMREAGDREGVYKNALAIYERLCATTTSPLDLVRRCQLAISVFRDQGMEAALKTLDEVDRAGVAEPPAKAELFSQFVELTGSLEAALAGTDLVRISLGSEPASEREQLFRSIAEMLPDGSRDMAPSFYQNVLIHRLPGESLASAGKRFLQVLRGCAGLGQPGLAPAVFELIQQGLREGRIPQDRADEAVKDFLRRSLVSTSLAEALSPVQDLAPPGSIQVGEDRVRIGSMSLPVRRL